MNFLYPALLAGLALLAIPIIVHLFNFRRFKKVYFTNVRFLREIKEESTVKSRLKHLLVLASRILALSLIVLAFAQPFIPSNEKETITGTNAVSIYIDNSFSMEAKYDRQRLISLAENKAREIVKAYNNEDEFQILTNDFEVRHQRLITSEEFNGYVDEIEISPQVRELKDVMERQKEILNKSSAANKVVFIISDFQESITNLEADSGFSVNLVRLQSTVEKNVFIDSCWLEMPVILLNKSNSLIVRLTNTGEQPIENSRLTLKINDQIKALTDFDIAANSTMTDTVKFSLPEPGNYKAELNIEDHPVVFDDSYFLTFRVDASAKILAINRQEPNKFIQALFADDEYFVLKNKEVNKLDYSEFQGYELIILNNLEIIPSGLAHQLDEYVKNGGGLVIFPGRAIDRSSYNDFLQKNECEYFFWPD